jgi:4-aminobutyrate aminotransferase/(S)-3-amino-2-methylpropionate transaminase
LPVGVQNGAFPGVQSQQFIKSLNKQGADYGGSLEAGLDYELSEGNYCVDNDGNRMLDTFMQIASLPLGYNHPDLRKLLGDSKFQAWSVSRAALGMYPPKGWDEVLESSLLKVAPPGMNKAMTLACGSCAVENAFKMAFIRKATQLRGGHYDFKPEEFSSCMKNQSPGCGNDLQIMSFRGGFHGRTHGALSATRSKAIHKLDIPAFEWPMADFPILKYPLDAYEAENAAEEQRCLDHARELFAVAKENGKAIAGMIIEPVLSEGGDLHASHDYFRKLRQIALEQDCAFIVDEVQTGVGTSGTMWAHEQWGLQTPPDLMTFSKKALTGGFYYADHMTVHQPFRVFNTWMGDPTKALQLKAVLETMERDNLLENVKVAGEELQSILKEFEKAGLIQNVRGFAAIQAFDCNTPEERTELRKALISRGVLVGQSGDRSIRFRPALIFTPEHARQFGQALEECFEVVTSKVTSSVSA